MILVGSVVIILVAVGGMTSTTYVQFVNGGLLLTFAAVLRVAVLLRGVNTTDRPMEEGVAGLESFHFQEIGLTREGDSILVDLPGARVVDRQAVLDANTGEEQIVFYRISRLLDAIPVDPGTYSASVKGRTARFESAAAPEAGWIVEDADEDPHVRIEEWWREPGCGQAGILTEVQSTTVRVDGTVLVNGAPESAANRLRQMGGVSGLPSRYGESTGPVGPLRLLSIFADTSTVIRRPRSVSFATGAEEVTTHYEEPVSGSTFMRPGEPAFTTLLNRLNFISLMLALFFGTSALPHILIRYYTVPSVDAARKSTIVAITGIGLFYILTMHLGVGAVAAAALNPATSNMSAPLLARSFGEVLFAVISGIAFTTVLATVSGLIMAASGAVCSRPDGQSLASADLGSGQGDGGTHSRSGGGRHRDRPRHHVP